MGSGKRSKALRKTEPEQPEIVGPRVPNGAQVITSEYSGPLPHPEFMRKYEEIQPGFANRIIESWEKETAHRRNLEDLAVRSDIANEEAISGDVKRGQYFAFFLAIGFLAAGFFLVLDGKQLAGAFFGSTGFIGIVLAFLNTAFKSREKNNGNAIEKTDE